MTTYTIELSYESGRTVEIPLTVKSDSQATQKMREYLQTHRRQLMDVNAFLSFHRTTDGQHGYINQDGASATGRSWK